MGKAATCSNAISSFQATGVYPYNPNAYLVDEGNNNELTVTVTARRQPEQEEVFVPTVVPGLTTPEREIPLEPIAGPSSRSSAFHFHPSDPVAGPSSRPDDFVSKNSDTISSVIADSSYTEIVHPSSKTNLNERKKETPSKLLQGLCPIPNANVMSTRKRAKTVATILTSQENLSEKKAKLQAKNKSNKNTETQKISLVKKRKKKGINLAKSATSPESSEEEVFFQESGDSESDVWDVESITVKLKKQMIGYNVSTVRSGTTNVEEQSYHRPVDIRRILQELEDEDSMQHEDEDISEDADDSDYKEERIENDNHDSDSEQQFEGADVEGDLELGENFQIHIGKDNAIIWVNEPMAHTFQTRSKTLSKIFLDPKGPLANSAKSSGIWCTTFAPAHGLQGGRGQIQTMVLFRKGNSQPLKSRQTFRVVQA
ncbi:hypothetical protein HHI36_010893 [Cryptolaemus montrouzieri]|uniref:Uncharacterized protein n=1 Tax=Cryptolaemus montrouzieri TaxID=559131 RepID=A0ABD2MK81_9CUCU